MSTCVKTGANCHISEYNAMVRCDVHYFEGVVIVSFNNETFNLDVKNVDLSIEIGNGYFSRSQGIIVVKPDQTIIYNDVIRDRIFK